MGCSRDGVPRVAVEGEVTYDGQPLAWGAIVFIPLPGTEGPKAATNIEQGRFQLPRKLGPSPGRHRVEIWSDVAPMRDVKRTEPIETVDIPPRFNRASELTAEPTPEGPNHFRFDLDSTP